MNPDSLSLFKGMGKKLKNFVPDEAAKGDPFTGLMECRDGRLTGSIYMIPELSERTFPLFFSKYLANKFLSTRSKTEQVFFTPRGFTREHLTLLVDYAQADGIAFMVLQEGKVGGIRWARESYSGNSLKELFIR